jgi:Fe-S cluster assembly protein SufD
MRRQSDDLALAGVEIEPSGRRRAGRHPLGARSLWRAGGARADPGAGPHAALNTAFATDGVLIRVTGKAAKPVSLVYLHKSDVGSTRCCTMSSSWSRGQS